jgi:hypothetical protein
VGDSIDAVQPANMQPAADRLLFIGGLHRSGTTMLAGLLAEHPDVASLRGTGVPKNEGQFLQAVYPPGNASGGPGRFAFGGRAHLTEADVADPAAARERLLASWTPFWDTSRRLLVEKSPPNLVRFRYLQQIFPDAGFIAIVRHPVAVSYATQKWSKGSIGRLVAHWLEAHEQFEADRAHVNRLLFVRYEDLVRDVNGTIAKIDAQFGLTAHAPAGDVQTASNERYMQRWWTTKWVPARVRVELTAARFERRVAALGYGYSLHDRH